MTRPPKLISDAIVSASPTTIFFFFKDPAPTEISPLPPHAPLPIPACDMARAAAAQEGARAPWGVRPPRGRCYSARAARSTGSGVKDVFGRSHHGEISDHRFLHQIGRAHV